MSISVTILTKNSAKYLSQVLEALKRFDEVIVYDTGSEDDTLAIARCFTNVAVHEGAFMGFGPTHNRASQLARHEWILSIDSDEIVTEELAAEVLALHLDAKTVYAVWRQNFYNGKWIRWCGWYPDYQYRLYDKRATCFSDAQVHEAIIVKGLTVVKLNAPLRHYPYADTREFLAKMQNYSTLYAQQAKGKPSSLWRAVSHGIFAFFKSYILKRGFMGGREGFVISVYNGNTAFYKYLKLIEANRTPGP